jgi:hypothetical protein
MSATAWAGDFSWDLSGGAAQSAVKGVDLDGSALGATYYFDSVDDSQGPYSLATFFDPASQLSLAMSRTRQTIHFTGLPPGLAPDLTTTTDDYTIGGRYWLSASKWYAGGAYTTSDIDSPSSPETLFSRDKSKAYRVFAGKYLGPKTSLELGLKRSVRESGQVVELCSSSAVCPIAGLVDIESETTSDDVGVSLLHVRRFRDLTYSLFGSVVQTSGRFTNQASAPLLGTSGNFEPYWTWSLGAEVFPTTKLGVRVAYTRADYDGAHGDSYDVAATWYLKRNLGIQLAWSRSQSHFAFTVPNVDTISLRFIGRL